MTFLCTVGTSPFQRRDPDPVGEYSTTSARSPALGENAQASGGHRTGIILVHLVTSVGGVEYGWMLDKLQGYLQSLHGAMDLH